MSIRLEPLSAKSLVALFVLRKKGKKTAPTFTPDRYYRITSGYIYHQFAKSNVVYKD